MTSESNSSPPSRKRNPGQADTTIPPDSDLSDAAVLARGSINPEAVPKEFDGYEVLEEIARGGMGIVYRAYQKSLDREVALKTVLAGNLASEQTIRLFHSEAKAAGNLNHPGIVPVYDVGECHGFHYFSMPLIDGTSLGDRIARGPMHPDEAAGFMKSVAETMQFAHDRNIVHRDLKPGNILIDAHGRPLITDFGIARKIDEKNTPGESQGLIGTAEYMSPEQAAGKSTGPLGDVYSLGATLYCLLTGRPPFQASNTLDTLLAVIETAPVPPRRLNERIPRDIDLICLKCLEKRPQDRYQSPQEVADELGRFLEGKPVLVHPVGNIGTFFRWTRREPRNAAIATGLVVSFAAALAISVYYNYQLNSQREVLNIQREIADAARREAELSEQRASRLQKTTEDLLARLATAESGLVQALQYSPLGEVCSAAINLTRVQSKDQRQQALGDFQTARKLLSDTQEVELQSALQKTEELASQNESEIDATKISVDDLISQARGLWLNATSDVPGTRKQIRTVLYVRANQLAEKIVSATDRPDAAADIVSFVDLVNAELSIVGDDRVYSLAAKAVATIEEWSMGPPPEALTEIAFELRQTIDRIEPQQP